MDRMVEKHPQNIFVAAHPGEKDNFMRKRTHNFEPIKAEKIRVTALATWGDPSARIMEIRAEAVNNKN